MVTPVSGFAVNVVTLLGIGLAVDYTLMLVHRFRDERTADPDAGPVSGSAGPQPLLAGRVFSGLAVAAAMFGLPLFAKQLLASIAQGGAIVAVLVTAVGLTRAARRRTPTGPCP